MQTKFLAIIVLIVIASLSVAGCTVGLPSTSSPTPTPTPSPTSTPSPTRTTPADYSKFFSDRYESASSIIVQPFTGTTNMRANEVYRGVIRNASQPGSKSLKIVIELTKSQNEAKQLFNQQVAEKTSQGYVFDSAGTANFKASEKSAFVDINDIWIGGG